MEHGTYEAPDQTPVELGYSDIKQSMSLQVIFDNNALKSLHDFDTIPFEAFQAFFFLDILDRTFT